MRPASLLSPDVVRGAARVALLALSSLAPACVPAGFGADVAAPSPRAPAAAAGVAVGVLGGASHGVPGEARAVDVVTVVPGDGHPDLGVLPPAPVVEGASRARRRMDLDQLDAAFLQATNGITWVEGGRNQWVALAATLGRPDFLTSTDEDLTPSPMFQKFLGDAARKVCSDLIARELQTPPSQRVLFGNVDPDESSARMGARLDENLARLLLRFHGRDTRAVGTQGALDGWRWLFLSSEQLARPRDAWNAVCVALIEHPDFYSY